MAKRGSKTAVALYLVLLIMLTTLTLISAFRLYPLNVSFFTRYLIALLFAAMILQMIPKVKIFDIIDIKRETKMFVKKK